MNINTLTIKAQEALQAALSLARERGQQAVEPLHLLAVLIREDDSLSTFLLGRVGVNVRSLRDEVGRAVASLPRVEGGGEQFFAQDTSKAIQRAVDFTKNFGDKYASVEHLLLALVAERGQAADILKRSGATEKELIEAIRTFRKGATVDSQTSEQQFDALGKYAINLNEQARSGKLDPVIGRDEEIRRVLQAARDDAVNGLINRDFVQKYIDRIFVTVENSNITLQIKLFTGESTMRYLEKLERRSGNTFKKMIETYEQNLASKG